MFTWTNQSLDDNFTLIVLFVLTMIIVKFTWNYLGEQPFGEFRLCACKLWMGGFSICLHIITNIFVWLLETIDISKIEHVIDTQTSDVLYYAIVIVLLISININKRALSTKKNNIRKIFFNENKNKNKNAEFDDNITLWDSEVKMVGSYLDL